MTKAEKEKAKKQQARLESLKAAGMIPVLGQPPVDTVDKPVYGKKKPKVAAKKEDGASKGEEVVVAVPVEEEEEEEEAPDDWDAEDDWEVPPPLTQHPRITQRGGTNHPTNQPTWMCVP